MHFGSSCRNCSSSSAPQLTVGFIVSICSRRQFCSRFRKNRKVSKVSADIAVLFDLCDCWWWCFDFPSQLCEWRWGDV